MMKNEWKKIVQVDYYKEVDGIGRKPLKNGDKLLIKFENGIEEIHIIHIIRASGSDQVDMNGFPDRFPTSKAYVLLEYNGTKVKAFLRQMNIKVRRIK